MPPVRGPLIERFKRLPSRSNEVWQGGVVRARTWIDEPDGNVRRPSAAMWVSLTTGMESIDLAPTDDASDPSLALQVLLDLGLKVVRCRPARLEVTDGTLGAWLAEALGDPELTVSVRADLPDVDRAVREMERGISGDTPPLPDALDAPGVTGERMRAFADAARDFYQAAPWQHLGDADLVHVEAPAVASGLRYFCDTSRCSAPPARRSGSASSRAHGSSTPCTRTPISMCSWAAAASGPCCTAASTSCRSAPSTSGRTPTSP